MDKILRSAPSWIDLQIGATLIWMRLMLKQGQISSIWASKRNMKSCPKKTKKHSKSKFKIKTNA